MPVSDQTLREWWIARFKCLHCLDTGIIFHYDDTDEPCDYCDAFSKKLERRAQLPGQAASTHNSNSN